MKRSLGMQFAALEAEKFLSFAETSTRALGRMWLVTRRRATCSSYRTRTRRVLPRSSFASCRTVRRIENQ